jgi:TRAP-type transport system periplasmic protein
MTKSSWRWRGIVAALATTLVMAGCGPAGDPAPDEDREPVTLRLLTGFIEGSVFNGPMEIAIPEIEERSDGLLRIEVSGPEVVPFTEQIDAVGSGVFDIQWTVPLFNVGQVPEGEVIYFISGDSSCAEYRDAGALDIYDEAHRAKANVMLLACGGGGAHGATFLVKEPIETIDDFDGMRFRGFGLYTRVLDQLGASSVAMPPPDIYSAVERGVVDGVAFPNLGIVELGLHEVTPYMLLPPYLPFRYAFYMNPESFETLPEDLQQILVDTLWDLEPQFDAFWRERRDAEHEELLELGVEIIELEPTESARLEQLVVDEMWAFIEENSPDFGPRLREAFEAVEDR